MSKLMISRILLLAGLAIGMISWSMTIGHVADPAYLLVEGGEENPTHAWYHAFREAIGDLAAITIMITIFFGPDRWRTRETWTVSLLLMCGYYAPFWIGTPFVPELAAPHIMAELVHIVMAALPLSALFLARANFTYTPNNTA